MVNNVSSNTILVRVLFSFFRSYPPEIPPTSSPGAARAGTLVMQSIPRTSPCQVLHCQGTRITYTKVNRILYACLLGSLVDGILLDLLFPLIGLSRKTNVEWRRSCTRECPHHPRGKHGSGEGNAKTEVWFREHRRAFERRPAEKKISGHPGSPGFTTPGPPGVRALDSSG